MPIILKKTIIVDMWYITAILSSVLWGFADALYERTFDDNDSLCSHKCIVFTGFTALIVFFCCIPFSESGKNVFELLKEYKTFFLIPLSYILAIFCEIKALKTVNQSIVSPVANTSCVFIFAILIAFYFFTGNKQEAINQISFFSVSGTIAITVGMFFLAKNTKDSIDTDSSAYGFAALALPILGSVFEGLETVFETLLIDDVLEEGIGTIDFIRLYSFFVIIIALCFWIFVSIKEHKLYFATTKKDAGLMGCAACEYIVLIPYCIALDHIPLFTAVISSIYSVFTIIFCRIINKTVLTRKQYSCISIIMFGILLFAFY